MTATADCAAAIRILHPLVVVKRAVDGRDRRVIEAALHPGTLVKVS